MNAFKRALNINEDYNSFFNGIREKVENYKPINDSKNPEIELLKLNYQRSKRISLEYKPSEKIIEIVQNINSPQYWIAITEEWCGDSAQILPYFAEIAKRGENIKIFILRRDDNLDIMNDYLTDGKMSVPIIIAFDEKGKEIFKWGPRPYEANALFKKMKNQREPKEEILKKIHLWYAQNKGAAIENEILKLLKKA